MFVVYYIHSEKEISDLKTYIDEELANLRAFKLTENYQGQHDLIVPHEHPSFTLNYPTVGLPTPGKPFNSTPVAKEHLASFDEAINEMFKPYNVFLRQLRILTANSCGSDTKETAGT